MCDGKWRDIETAPKDGTKMLVLTSGVILIAAYDDRPKARAKWKEGSVYGNGLYGGEPTHWMPLPPPPSPAEPGQ